VYVLPAPAVEIFDRERQRLDLVAFVNEVTVAQNLAVIKTPPGHANGVGRAIDLLSFPGMLGSVAGDDTLLVGPHHARGGAQAQAPPRRHGGRRGVGQVILRTLKETAVARVAVIGAAGYSGGEFARLALEHPGIALEALVVRSRESEAARDVASALPGRRRPRGRGAAARSRGARGEAGAGRRRHDRRRPAARDVEAPARGKRVARRGRARHRPVVRSSGRLGGLRLWPARGVP
jgi:hypothetical protein